MLNFIMAISAALSVHTAQTNALDISDAQQMIDAGVDRKAVHQRLMRGAKQACRRHGELGLEPRRWERECRAELMDKAVIALSDAQLVALHQQKRDTKLASQ